MWDSFVSSNRSTRSPGGPLLSSDIFKVNEVNYSELNKWKLDDCVFGFKENLINDKDLNERSKPSSVLKVNEIRTKLNQEVINTVAERTRRRRPTYSAKVLRALSKNSDDSIDESTDTEEFTESSKDLRQNKILEYRKLLTRTIKVKTSILSEKAKVMCSKDGNYIEWYKSKSDGDFSKKPSGLIPVSQITNVTTKSDNIKHLEISVTKTSFIFVFRTREEREQWQTEFKKFLKFMELIK